MLRRSQAPRPPKIKLTALSAVNCRKLLKSRRIDDLGRVEKVGRQRAVPAFDRIGGKLAITEEPLFFRPFVAPREADNHDMHVRNAVQLRGAAIRVGEEDRVWAFAQEGCPRPALAPAGERQQTQGRSPAYVARSPQGPHDPRHRTSSGCGSRRDRARAAFFSNEEERRGARLHQLR
jgi:hypothetical protein